MSVVIKKLTAVIIVAPNWWKEDIFVSLILYTIFIVKSVLKNGLMILNPPYIRNYMKPKHKSFTLGFTLGFIFIIIRLSPEKMRNKRIVFRIPLFPRRSFFLFFSLEWVGACHRMAARLGGCAATIRQHSLSHHLPNTHLFLLS